MLQFAMLQACNVEASGAAACSVVGSRHYNLQRYRFATLQLVALQLVVALQARVIATRSDATQKRWRVVL